MKKFVIGILVILALGALYVFGAYNEFVRMNEAIDGQWAQVESQYQRRFDLIPNLVASTQGILKQEQEVFGSIAEARTRYAGAQTVDEKAAAAGEVESALARLLAIVENYPQLRSSETVQSLMDQLEGTENRIAVARQRYNEQVRDYNTKVKTMPTALVARWFGFGARAYFEAATGADVVPQVKL